MRTMTRQERIETLLDHYAEMHYVDATSTSSSTTGGIAGLNLLRHPSVRELTRCLTALAMYAPLEHSHLKAYYTAEWRIAYKPRRMDIPTVKARERAVFDPKHKNYAYRERVLPNWVDRGRVARAVGWVAWDGLDHDEDGKPAAKPSLMPSVTIAFKGEPFIPDELLEAAA